MSEIRPGIRFLYGGGLMEVVKPNPKIPGDWFCEAVGVKSTGLWSFNPTGIVRRAMDYNLGR